MNKLKDKKFIVVYLAFLLVVLIASCAILCYAHSVLMDYEESQPESVLDANKNLIKEQMAEFCFADYDDVKDVSEEKRQRIRSAKEITFCPVVGLYNNSEREYEVICDGEPLGTVFLESISSKKRLLILTVSKWKINSSVPIVGVKRRSYSASLPVGYKMVLNGHFMGEKNTDEAKGTDVYELGNLYAEPTVELYNEKGEQVGYEIKDGVIVPGNFTLKLEVPNGMDVYVDKGDVRAEVNGINTIYNVTTPFKYVYVSDAYGNTVKYTVGKELKMYEYRVTVPESFKLQADYFDAEDDLEEFFENEKYASVSKYGKFPKQKTYLFRNALDEPEISIVDNNGNVVDAEYIKNEIKIEQIAGESEVPKEISDSATPLETAKKWSLFLTRDLPGDEYGFQTMKEYLVKDSVLYKAGDNWAHGIDITLTSDHRLCDPAFVNESISNYVRYNERCFSCDIAFVEQIILVKTSGRKNNKINARIFFYLDDDGKWKMLEMTDILG